ncbi:MAG: YqeG family HAD IIIA-type phosphatase [Firmicutes bacterium]|nr:YqeG family HAD IIIA-type phosphatase [Bacillota bacterium]
MPALEGTGRKKGVKGSSGVGRLARLVCPDLCCPSIGDIDLAALKRCGIEGLIVDVDNTLVEWNRHEPTEALHTWFDAVRAAGLRCCIVSNSRRRDGIAAFAKPLGVPFVVPAGKPSPRPFRLAMNLLGTDPSNTAVVGDQVLTDVLGGNALGLYTVLVKPIGTREFAGTRLVRRFERMILRYLRRRGLIPEDPPTV